MSAESANLLHSTLRARGVAPRAPPKATRIREVIAAVVSFTVLVCALFVILSQRYDPSVKNWAFGTSGMILGYWMRRQ